MTSIYVEGVEMSDVEKCADIGVINKKVEDALEAILSLVNLVRLLYVQRGIVSNEKFTYRIELFDFKKYGERQGNFPYIVSVLKCPSTPGLKIFRVDGTYRECCGKGDAIYQAKKLVEQFKETGITVEFNEEKIDETH
jgi:hypothetical protein